MPNDILTIFPIKSTALLHIMASARLEEAFLGYSGLRITTESQSFFSKIIACSAFRIFLFVCYSVFHVVVIQPYQCIWLYGLGPNLN